MSNIINIFIKHRIQSKEHNNRT